LIDFYEPQGHVDLSRVAGESYRLDRCHRCGLVFQRFVPNDEFLMEIYEEWIDPDIAYRADYASRSADYYARHAREIEQILRLLGRTVQSTRTLDFGMGWAEWAIMAAAYGCDSAGTELSPRRREHARSRGVRLVDEVGGEQFDCINAEQVFEHVTNPLLLLSDLKAALAPDGIVKISVPNGWDIDRRLARSDWSAGKDSPHSLNPVAPLEHLNCFSLAAMDAMAAECGMARIPLPTYAAVRQAPRQARLADLGAPARRAAKRVMTRGAWRLTYGLYRKTTPR